MTTAEQIYRVVKELPESMRQEVLDFVDFLKQKTIPDEPQSGNLAIRIHNRFKGLDADNLPVPPRQLSRNTAEVPEKIKREISVTYYWKISYRISVILITVTTLGYF